MINLNYKKTCVHFPDDVYNYREYGFFLGFINGTANVKILDEKPHPNNRNYVEVIEFKTRQELHWFIRKEGLNKYLVR
jgi:hypothetical protein